MATSGVELDDTEQAILDFVEDRPGAFVGTAEVADHIGMTNNGASYRLKELKKKGWLDSRQPSRDEVWYIPETQPESSQPGAQSMGLVGMPSLALSKKAILETGGALTAVGSFAAYYGALWGGPLLLWVGLTLWFHKPDRDKLHPKDWGESEITWLSLQPVGAWIIMFSSWVGKYLFGVGPGIAGLPNLVPGVDVTFWILVGLGGFILGAMVVLAVISARSLRPAAGEGNHA